MPQIIIIEDSSRYDLGGGQRVTLDAINCLLINKENKISLFDLGSGPDFKTKILLSKIECKFFGISGILSFFVNLISVVIEIIDSINTKSNFFIYATTKKALITSIVIRLFHKRAIIVFHQHSHLGRYFEWLKRFTQCVVVPGAIKGSYSKKTIIIPNRINIASSECNHKFMHLKDITIGFIGNLTINKGFDIFLDICSSPGVQAVIAGSGTLESKIPSKNNIKFLGYVNEEQKKDFYREIDILIFPSIIDETFSLVCFEAMFSHIPVVCFDIGYPSIIVNKYNTGVVSKSMTVKSLIFSIQKCAKDQRKLSNNCSKVIKDFNNDNFCTLLTDVFKEK
jgi:glycosyltransferase involved in cell wall biosynthesis